MLHVIVAGVIIIDAVIGSLALIFASTVAIFGLEIEQVWQCLLRGGRCGRRCGCRRGTSDLVQETVIRTSIVDQRIILRPVKELELARVLLVTVDILASAP